MDDDGTLQLAREAKLPAEHGVLDVARREVVVVVEADFADGPRGRRGLNLRPDKVRRLVRLGCAPMGLVWVHAHSEPAIGPGGRDAVRLGRLLLDLVTQN